MARLLLTKEHESSCLDQKIDDIKYTIRQTKNKIVRTNEYFKKINKNTFDGKKKMTKKYFL